MSSADHYFEDDGTAAAESNTSAEGVIIGLNAWIDAAIQTLKIASTSTGHNNPHNNTVVCSREYLLCALKLAHSLADQLCVVDEKKKVTSATVDVEKEGAFL